MRQLRIEAVHLTIVIFVKQIPGSSLLAENGQYLVLLSYRCARTLHTSPERIKQNAELSRVTQRSSKEVRMYVVPVPAAVRVNKTLNSILPTL
jgi:hypothetical protein